jgi:signal transduction histidine kinase
VDALVGSARRRNLLVGFTALLLLGSSTLLLFAAARRARRTAERQMEFVAAVSHELRTPVAVICSAGENLADGVVEGRDKVARYGTLVRDEGRRLHRALEQVLDFAGTYTGRRRYRKEPVDVETVVDEALHAASHALNEAGASATREIAPGLPPLLGDAPALARAVRNLVENAAKYGGSDRAVALRALRRDRSSRPWVRIEVEDHGFGIPEAERKHLFEPFWRGDEATARQIRGSGLGLALVHSIATAHGGEVQVTSAPGEGSVFALELPGADLPRETSGARHESTHDDVAHPAG